MGGSLGSGGLATSGKGSSGGVASYGLIASRPLVGAFVGHRWTAPDAVTPFVWDGAKWCPEIGGVLGVTPPAKVALNVPVNGGGGLASLNQQDDGSLEMLGYPNASGDNLHGFFQATGGVQAEAIIRPQSPGVINAGMFTVFGVALRESGTGKVAAMCITLDHNARVSELEFDTWTGPTTRVIDQTFDAPTDPNGPVILRVRHTGATIFAEFSRGSRARDAKGWTAVRAIATTSVFTAAPDQGGIIALSYGGITPRAMFVHLELL